MQPRQIVVPLPRAVYVPPWMPVAFGELGVLEDTRPGKSTSRIEQYHAITSGGPAVDDVPWCASWVSWCLEMAGIKSTKSKRAASYAEYGVESPLVFGAIVLMAASDKDAVGSGHVGFAIGPCAADTFFLFGGNQSQRVDVGLRKRADIAAIRWPAGTPLPPMQKAA